MATTRWATRPARRTTRAGAAAGRRALALRDVNFVAPGAATAETVKALMSSVARRGQRARCAAASRVAFWINVFGRFFRSMGPSIQDFAAWHSLPLFCLQVKAFNMLPGPPLRARAARAPRTRVTGQREREACPE